MYMCACIVIIQSLFRIIIYKMLYYKICSSSITVIKELKILYPPDYFPKETLIRIICLCIVWIDFALEVSENFHQCLVQKKDLLVNGILTVLTMGFHGYSFPCPSLTDFAKLLTQKLTQGKSLSFSKDVSRVPSTVHLKRCFINGNWLALLVLLLIVVVLCFFPGNWLLESFAELWFGEQGLTLYILLSASNVHSKNLNA